MPEEPFHNADHIRVDERLLHGQILQAWLPRYEYRRLIIADDECYEDPLLRKVLKIAVPPEILADIIPLNKAVAEINNNLLRPFMIIVRSLEFAARLIGGGSLLKNVMIGVVHYNKERRLITNSVFLSRRELTLWEELQAEGASVAIQTVPLDRPIGLIESLSRYGSFPGEGAI